MITSKHSYPNQILALNSSGYAIKQINQIHTSILIIRLEFGYY